MTRGTRPYKVGITAAVIGLPLFLVLPFATVRRSRIATGVDMPPLEALGPLLTVAVAALWVAVVVLSLREGGRGRAAARGLLGASIIISLVVLSGWAASTLGPQVGQFARVSIGGGAWVSGIAAYSLVLASRRALGRGSAMGVLVGVLAPVAIVALLLSGFLDDLGIMKEYANVADRFWVETANTAIFAAVSVSLASAVGIYLGIVAFQKPAPRAAGLCDCERVPDHPGACDGRTAGRTVRRSILRTPVPATLGIGGIGWAPVVTALTLYALLAIVRNTYAGLRSVPPAVVDAGRGMGMADGQLMRKVELPLGMPVVFSGVRTSTVQTIGNATLGAFVGGITLGRFIFQGLAEQSPDLTMLGSIALVVMAVLVDGALRLVQDRAFRTHTVTSERNLP